MRYSTKKFMYHKDTKSFTADASDVGVPNEVTLISHKTGTEVTYVLEHVQKDSEGDVQYWLYVDYNRGMPGKGSSVKIFND